MFWALDSQTPTLLPGSRLPTCDSAFFLQSMPSLVDDEYKASEGGAKQAPNATRLDHRTINLVYFRSPALVSSLQCARQVVPGGF